MSRGKGRTPQNGFMGPRAMVDETLKISVERALKLFVDDEDQTELAFPSSLTNEERKYIHQNAPKMGLVTNSRGHGTDRFITVYKKKDASAGVLKDATIDLHSMSRQLINQLLRECPLTEKERSDLRPQDGLDGQKVSYRQFSQADSSSKSDFCNNGQLNFVLPQIPRMVDIRAVDPNVQEIRQSLPIASYRHEILSAIYSNPVILVSGDTGCGKTTQVPQFIMEDCAERRLPCRILVAEPRRLAAISVADRVSAERGETVGQSVGYQIRLESKVSPRTITTYCTNGVILRTLMGSDHSFESVTHIVVDEVHERDRMCDLLITVMREMVLHGAPFKLIIMSATFDTDRFVNYFGGCPVVKIPGKMYEVKYHFLEEILKVTGWRYDQMEKFRKKLETQYSKQKYKLLKWCPEGQNDLLVLPNEETIVTERNATQNRQDPEEEEMEDYSIPDEVKKKVNDLLKAVWCEPSQEVMEELLSVYINDGVPIDYKHPETGVTALIVSTVRGLQDFVEAFLRMGASVSIRTCLNDWNAIEWAKHFGSPELVDLLTAHLDVEREDAVMEADMIAQSKELSDEDKNLLESYHRTFDDEVVDLPLILCLIQHICINGRDDPKGAILVFLPGYDEIVTLRQMVIEAFEGLKFGQYVMFTLHSQMQCTDHRRVFRPVPSGTRKIILSTNIAETSVTIDDVVYVIDCGKVKEKSYDALMGVTCMKSVRISQASAIQRRGRAGRVQPGICYHLFSSYRFHNMEKFQVPEIVRMSAHELCLQSKLLAPGRPLTEFLSKLPDPPSAISVKNSISLLKAIDAFDQHENLTELGMLLLDLPIEPHLGKIILHSVVLKCLDPILTIVCSITYKDPFVIPANPMDKHKANRAKEQFSSNSMSDHMVLLKAFQQWQKAKSDNYEAKFCKANFISSSTMEIIFGLRTQLLGQLRASGFVRTRGTNDIRDLNANSEKWGIVKAALTAGYYPNVMRLNRKPKRPRLITRLEPKVSFHPSSVLSMGDWDALKSLKSEWFVYEELSRIGVSSYARTCSLISPLSIAIFGGPCRLSTMNFIFDAKRQNGFYESDSDIDNDDIDSDEDYQSTSSSESHSIIKIDDWVSFRCKQDVATSVWQLRQKWQSMFLRRIQNPHKLPPMSDGNIVKCLADIFDLEEQRFGITQPIGVGQRPIPMASSYCSPVADCPSTLKMIKSPNAFAGGSGSSYGGRNFGRGGGRGAFNGRSPKNKYGFFKN